MLELMGLTPSSTGPKHLRDRKRERHPKAEEQPTIAMPVSEQIPNSCSAGSRTESGEQLLREEVVLPADAKINQRTTGIPSAISPLLPYAWLTPCCASLHLIISVKTVITT